jgi:hypothetical protein
MGYSMKAKIRFAIVAAALAAATGGLAAAGAVTTPAAAQVQLQAGPNSTGTAQGQVSAVNENPRN